ncbi:hypothetical protein MA123_002170 [Escherichia coli]|uniref:hypothetical protein n=1 Tax=Escherichia coli TaxID=562 RepID=UPI0019E5AD07|nr:hypothetical protein [Escherichia coli]EGO4444527.1 hypothetical protein [Escherichia coli]EIV7738365.1 hypothetical protein [Escherichia coli]MBP2740354.1 hypothetical protein [Escherichia coli]MBS9553031.1 hypothetical protein [Escherichia coli]MBW9560310.1 hypothetical protein [Escherichia coli]
MVNYIGAQCSPRHACPFKKSLLMPLQRRTLAAPRMALAGITATGKHLQNHASFGCIA